MTPATSANSKIPGLTGYALIGIRIVLMLALLIIVLPCHAIWRLFGLGRFWARVFLAGVGIIAGLDVRTTGKPAPGAMLLANHVSWLDIPALSHASGAAFVGHDGLAGHPFLKWLCQQNDTVFIARHIRTTVAQQVEQVREAFDDSGRLAIFPEGTTGDGTALLPFKSALLSALEPLPDGAIVQPVWLDYAEVPDIAWVGDEHGLDNFKLILSRLRPVRLTIHFLEPLTGAALADRKAMAAAAQGAIATAMELSQMRQLR